MVLRAEKRFWGGLGGGNGVSIYSHQCLAHLRDDVDDGPALPLLPSEAMRGDLDHSERTLVSCDELPARTPNEGHSRKQQTRVRNTSKNKKQHRSGWLISTFRLQPGFSTDFFAFFSCLWKTGGVGACGWDQCGCWASGGSSEGHFYFCTLWVV